MDRRALALLLTAACAEPVTTELRTQPPTETTAARLVECGAAELWSTAVQGPYGLDPRAPWFVDAQGLVARGRGIYFGTTAFLRAHDGEVIIVAGADIASIDRAHTRAVRMSHELATLVDFASGEVIATLGDHHVRDAALTPDGRYVLTLRGYGETIVERWDADGASTALFAEDGLHTESLGAVTDRALFVTGTERFSVVDVETGAVRRSPRLVTGDERLLDVVPSPDASRLAVTTSAGRILVLGADFSQLEPPRAGAVVRVNENIYAPIFDVTPVAWSADGALFTYLRADGELVVESNGEAALAIPPRPKSEHAFVEGPALPVSVAFTPDLANLAVQYEHEFAMHGCAIDAPTTRTVDVTLEVPDVVRAEEVVELTVRHDVTSALVGHRFRVDGERVGPETAERTTSWRPRERGTFVVEVTVDDGRHVGTASRVVQVR